MLSTAKDWLQKLMAEARSAQLDHVDVLINCTALPAPLLPALLELTPAPLCAWLFEDTPEQALAPQGPVLLRIALTSQEQCTGFAELLSAVHHHFCVLAIISRQPFDDLAAHLRASTQATWSDGSRNGVLRYYDTRLFRHFCEQLDPHQQSLFHAPVIQWHWIDHDSKAAVIYGFDSRKNGQPTLSSMSLSDEQVLHLHAVTAAIQWFKNGARTPFEHGFTSREAMIRSLVAIHLEISLQKLEKQHHEDFIAKALDEHRPLTLTPSESYS
jgi:hypothetical protein